MYYTTASVGNLCSCAIGISYVAARISSVVVGNQTHIRKIGVQPRKTEKIIDEDTLDTLEVETTPEPTEQIILKSQEPSSYHIIQPPFL